MRICPCCGYKSESVLRREWSDGCQSCGTRPVGEPLPRPDNELPSFGRSLVLTVTGALLLLVFLSQTIIALAARASLSFGFWSWMAAAETAAWRLKWLMIPVTLLVFYGSGKLYRSIKQSPSRFCGLRYARWGYLASLAVPLLVLVLIGITVPKRLEQRAWARDAQAEAYRYRFDRATDEYREMFGGVPSDVQDLARKLPDPDGSIAEALRNLDTSGYTPSAEVAAVPNKKPQQLRGAVIRNASITTDDSPSERLSFTNYELPLPGPDKIMGTEDDLLLRDGVTYKASEAPRRSVTSVRSVQTRKP